MTEISSLRQGKQMPKSSSHERRWAVVREGLSLSKTLVELGACDLTDCHELTDWPPFMVMVNVPVGGESYSLSIALCPTHAAQLAAGTMRGLSLSEGPRRE